MALSWILQYINSYISPIHSPEPFSPCLAGAPCALAPCTRRRRALDAWFTAVNRATHRARGHGHRIQPSSVLAPSSKALVTRSDALVTSSFLLLLVRHLLLEAMHLLLEAMHLLLLACWKIFLDLLFVIFFFRSGFFFRKNMFHWCRCRTQGTHRVHRWEIGERVEGVGTWSVGPRCRSTSTNRITLLCLVHVNYFQTSKK